MHLRAPVPGMGQPMSLVEIGDRTDDRIVSMLDAEILRWTAVAPEMAEPLATLRGLVSAGGKRLRPAFCYWSFVGAGGEPNDAAVVDVGAALELLHTFALVHDDIMDGSDMRRGRAAVHRSFIDQHVSANARGEARRFGEGAAILIGDFAFVYADMLFASAPSEARPVFDELRLELCVGQYLDLAGMANGPRLRARADVIERYKSGKYTVERPLHLGAALAGRLDELADGLSAFGLPLGHAFQMRDDLLGVFGDPALTGKPVGDDLREGKLTPLIAAAVARVDRDGDNHDAALLDRLGATDLSDDEIRAVQDLLFGCGAVADVEGAIAQYLDEALAALAELPIRDEARAALEEIATFVAWRDL
ncbi:MAG: polyprenyl synthetase family protein [Acidimicrobiia bacterium]